MSDGPFVRFASFRGEGKWRPKPGSTVEARFMNDEHPDFKDSYKVRVTVNEERTNHPHNIKEPTTENWPDWDERAHFAVDVEARLIAVGPHREPDDMVMSHEEMTYQHISTFFTDRPGVEWRPDDYRRRVKEELAKFVRQGGTFDSSR